jgi:hypothetical protein
MGFDLFTTQTILEEIKLPVEEGTALQETQEGLVDDLLMRGPGPLELVPDVLKKEQGDLALGLGAEEVGLGALQEGQEVVRGETDRLADADEILRPRTMGIRSASP